MQFIEGGFEKTAAPPGAALVEEPYQQENEDVIFEILNLLWQRRILITAICAAAIILAGVGYLLVDPRYEATAVIQLDLVGKDTPDNKVGTASIDGGKIVESHARLIRARAIARRVVVRLGLNEIQTDSKIRSFIAKIIGKLHLRLTPAPSRIDLSAEWLLSNLTVENDQMSYVIKVKYSARNPKQAAQIANAVVREYMQMRYVQKLANRRAFIARELRKLEDTYGSKHPLVASAKANLARAHALLGVAELDAETESEQEISESDLIVPAHEVTIPSGPKLITILVLALFGGLIGAIGFALLLDRRAIRRLYS